MTHWLPEIAPSLGTILLAGVIIVIGRFIATKTASDKRTLPFRRQFLTVVVGLFSLFLAIALLPISTDIRAQILSVLGILLSAIVALSSTTLVGNAMAGIMLRLMKGFRAGDFVRVGDLVGRISDIGLLHCEIQTITRDLAVVPNSVLVGGSISVTRRTGTFVNVTVSIGYTTHHTEVERLLIDAATRTGLSEPFVYIVALLDHAIQYRVYGLLEDTSSLLTKTSELRKSVLDVLHENDVEIASPSLVDRRELERERNYLPPRSNATTHDQPTEPVEEIAFDRAEEAESIDRLYAIQERLRLRLRDEESKAIEEQLQRIDLEIERREQKKEENKIDEEASE